MFHPQRRKSRRTKGSSMIGRGIYDKTVNYLTGSDLKHNEKHPILYTKDGFKPGTYLGPGTDLSDKIREGVAPITASDKTAQAHDLRYSLAENADDIRKADKRMLSVLDRVQKNEDDYLFNIYQGKIGIRGKMFLENYLGVKPEAFGSFGGVSNDDRPIFQAKLDSLEQQGYGFK